MYTSLAGIEVEDKEDLSKQDFRITVWDYMYKTKIVKFPLPVRNRIPNFEGGKESGQKVAELPEFTSAQTIKVNPDKPQEEVRFLTLQSGKRLLVPTPRLRTGLFNLLEKDENDDQRTLRFKAQSEGLKIHSKSIDLDTKVDINLIVLGSVAVSRTGRRIGKGEGFADIEYGMMRTMDAVDDSVKIITTVHDCQVFEDLPSRIFADHDVPVDIIVTPTQVIEVTNPLPRPQGIYWPLLTVEKFLQIPILRMLYEREQSKGLDIELKERVIPPAQEEIDKYQESIANRGRNGGRGFYNNQRGSRGGRPFRRNYRSKEGKSEDEGVDDDLPPLEGGKDGESQRGRRTREYRRGRGWRPKNSNAGRDDQVEGGGGGAPNRGNRWNTKQSQEETVNGDDENIQVTINVNKHNRIIRRKVEATNQRDRVGSADAENADSSEGEQKNSSSSKSFRYTSPPTFSLFVGGIPRFCRPYELRSELANHGIQPSYITWRGSNGFAFLNFHEDKNKEDDILLALKGLAVKRRTLTVAKAKGKVYSEEVHSEEVYSEEVHSEEVHSEEVHSEEVHSEEVHSEEVHSEEVHSEEVHSEDQVSHETSSDKELGCPVEDTEKVQEESKETEIANLSDA